MKLATKKIFSYTVMPQILPRIKELLFSGLQYVPYLIALVYGAVRLLPRNHPYLNPLNMGQFGVRHVIAEAANNLVISRRNIDQIVLFCVILVGMVMVVLQASLLLLALFSPEAMAQGTGTTFSFSQLFVTPEPAQDLAYIFMDMVFGVEGIFNSCVSSATETCQNVAGRELFKFDEQANASGADLLNSYGFPFPLHLAMHQLFAFYSTGLLIVATLITMYFITTILAETAQTGTPFGKRFNKVWAPIRIVVAFGLLLPLGSGLNSAQYLTLYSAKFGSSFATNAWNLFNIELGGANFAGAATPTDPNDPNAGTPGSNGRALITKSNVPDIGGLLQFIYTSRVCKEMYDMRTGLLPNQQSEIRPYLVRDPVMTPTTQVLGQNEIQGTDFYKIVIDFAAGDSTVFIRFGRFNATDYPKEKGYVSPICGEIAFNLTDPRNPENTANPPEPGPAVIQENYLYRTLDNWYYEANLNDMSTNLARRNAPWNPNANAPLPDTDFVSEMALNTKDDFESWRDEGIDQQIAKGSYATDQNLLKKGWAGAGIWYNSIAEINGVMTAATMTVPNVVRYPAVMEGVLKTKKKSDGQIDARSRFAPTLANGKDLPLDGTWTRDEAKVLNTAFTFFLDAGLTTTSHNASEGNALADFVGALLGTDGLFDMREQNGVHPLAKLTGVGRALVESAVRNVGFSVGASVGGALVSSASSTVGELGSTMIGFAMTFAMIGLTVGFVLFYVVPFLPFIYFFFAVSGWVKGIFEAMVGVPLWALAHIRIDGPGLPGQAAMSGYILIFEIFLRPILILFGLLASIIIFGALVDTLNEIWDLVVSNLAGYNPEDANNPDFAEYARKPIDEFFYTVLYTIVVYLMAMASFKLCDTIPNNILRWMGQQAKTFNDEAESPAEGLTGKAGVGAQQVLDSVGGGFEKMLASGAKGQVDGSKFQ